MEMKKYFLKDLGVGDYGIYTIFKIFCLFFFPPQIYFNIFLSHHFPVSMVLWDPWAYISSQNLREGSTF